MRFDLNNRLALITGGGSGIGEACGRALMASGERVVLVDRHRARFVAASVGIKGVAARELDVNAEKDVLTVVTRVEDSLGPISFLVNWAAILQDTLPHNTSLWRSRAAYCRLNCEEPT